VWKLDRWGRSLVDLITTLHELTALGVGFVSLTEALDLTTWIGSPKAILRWPVVDRKSKSHFVLAGAGTPVPPAGRHGALEALGEDCG
jgi:hypothetical protein